MKNDSQTISAQETMMDQTKSNSSNINIEPEYSGLSLLKTLIVLLVIICIGIAVITYLNKNKPEARTIPPQESVVTVDASKVDVKDYIVQVSSNGSVAAKTSSTIVAQISGEITSISDNFASGADFKKGDLLLSIDQGNYLSAISSAQASLAQAESTLESEQASAEQAIKDWRRLGYSGEPNDRVLRKPQLDAAKAHLDAAKASYNKAQLDLSRTKIRAPYDGSVVDTDVGLGQFVSMGTPLGNIFSNQGLEIKLPVNQEEYAQLDLSNQAEVALYAELAGQRHTWQAKVVRADRAFDTSTRQLNIIAEIVSPISDKGLELKIGQYLNATINGIKIPQAKIVSNTAIREGRYVFIFENGVLRRQEIDIVWQDDNFSIVNNLDENAMIVTTSLGSVVSGSKAKLVGQEGTQGGRPNPNRENADGSKPEGASQRPREGEKPNES